MSFLCLAQPVADTHEHTLYYFYSYIKRTCVFFQSSQFRGIESLNEFLTSQERQGIILQLLNSLRAERGDSVAGKLDFLEGEAISKLELGMHQF